MVDKVGDVARRFQEEKMVKARRDGQALRFWVESFPGYDMEFGEEAAMDLIGKFEKWEESAKERSLVTDIDVGYAIDYARRMAEATEYGGMDPESFEREKKFWQVRQQIGEKAPELKAQKSPHKNSS